MGIFSLVRLLPNTVSDLAPKNPGKPPNRGNAPRGASGVFLGGSAMILLGILFLEGWKKGHKVEGWNDSAGFCWYDGVKAGKGGAWDMM